MIGTPNQLIEAKKFLTKSVVSTSKVRNKTKKRATRRNLQAQPKIIKKYQNTKSNNQNEKKS
jgi:hypothetical protein